MNIEKFIGDLNKEYEDYIVGFADILGFKNKIAENEGNPLEISALCYVMSECVKQTDLFNEIDVRLFSDCLYVFGKKERFLDIVKLLTWLTASLFNVIPRRIDAQKGIENYVGSNLLRGGVTYGRALIGNNIFFGPAINEAYNIESNIAKYPRIVFSETVWSAVEKPGYIKKDNKGTYYLDFIESYKEFYGEACFSNETFDKHISAIERQIEEQKEEYEEKSFERKPTVKEKLEWMIDYLKVHKIMND